MRAPVALVLRALGLGDFLTGLPALQLVRQALPWHRLVLAAPAALAPLVALVPAIDELFVRGELQPLTDFDRPVDVGIDLHGKGPASRRLLTELRPARLVGFADPVAGLDGPEWYPEEHEVRRWCRLVDEAFGLDLPPTDWPGVRGSLAVPPADGSVDAGVTIVHPGAAAGARRWPADRFTAVAAHLAGRGHRVRITGGGAEHALAQRVAQQSGTTAHTGSTLSELAALVAGARLVVCGDTGVAHLASAYGTPSVLLFGPVSPALWGPPADPRHVVLWHGDGTGDPHGSDPDPALLQISVPEVVEAVDASENRPVAAGQNRGPSGGHQEEHRDQGER